VLVGSSVIAVGVFDRWMALSAAVGAVALVLIALAAAASTRQLVDNPASPRAAVGGRVDRVVIADRP
jgi:glucose uptake protein GlcU